MSAAEGQATPREPLSKRVVLAHLAEGVRIGGYIIERPLGAGGMGQVYLALDERLGRRVALKILPPDDADAEARARFLREAKALARVEHVNVVRVFASGEDDGTAWMALEVVDGDPLSSLSSGQISGEQGLDEETACALMAQVARGLIAVHAVGVVHRDIKPENLLVDNDAVVKIVDFGVALLADPGSGGFTTRKGVVVGTPHFMSPEQARGASVDTRSDAWAVGATLYALLTARPPFYLRDSEPDLDILARVLREPVPDVRTLAPSTSPATVSLLRGLLEKEPAQRLADLALVASSLDDIAAALARGERPGDEAAVAVAVSDAMPALPSPSPLPLTQTQTTEPKTSGVRVASVALLLVLLAAAVLGGAAIGRALVEPQVQVQERVVEKRVEVPVPVPATPPTPTPPTTPTLPALPPTLPEAVKPDALARHVLEAPAADVPALVGQLLARDDDAARAALALVASSPASAGDLVLSRIRADQRGDLPTVIEAALFSPSVERARQTIALLDDRRDDFALKLLMRAANEHRNPAVRRAAADVRDTIFKVED